jgi:hypothetical protein
MPCMRFAPCAVRSAWPANGERERLDMADEPAKLDETIDAVIADCGGDARQAVAELVAIIRSLIHENEALREAASAGFVRRRPIVFGSSSN